MDAERAPRRLVAIALAAALAAAAASRAQEPWNRSESLLAVVTHKAGLASGFAHEHLVVAADYLVEGSPSEGEGLSVPLTVRVPSGQLIVDDSEIQGRWEAHLLERGAVAEPFADLSDSDRTKIRRAMLAEDQLAASTEPWIVARLLEVFERDPSEGPSHGARLELTVRGVTVEREIDGWVTVEEEGTRLEALGRFSFTEFGIEPYKAMLGAVKVEDEFDLFLSLARPSGPWWVAGSGHEGKVGR